jgi:hypothetical protein
MSSKFTMNLSNLPPKKRLKGNLHVECIQKHKNQMEVNHNMFQWILKQNKYIQRLNHELMENKMMTKELELYMIAYNIKFDNIHKILPTSSTNTSNHV